MRKLTFITGAAVGFVLGARAGRGCYDRIAASARRVAENPAVRNSVETAAHNGREAAVRAGHAVADRAGDRLPGSLSQKLRSVQGRQNPLDDDWGSGAA
ncbi:YtxH domain-containing protein [Streptomyces lonarensis]|uniref:YtxH domain-containing protein n=1 Tax=Streptomyces lonarensis TaxID=700599 RepID=A0A7X6CWX0_9ACTN|nr:YtxH domain-containing protein [Streptomyces lonarensis]NJQ04062.1 YtxH domain-containing protein [Streptomyces lonarensis]